MLKAMNSIIRLLFSRSTNNIHVRRSSKHLPLTVSLLDPRTKAVIKQSSSTMRGYLGDINKTGLSLVISSVHFGDPFLMCNGYILLVKLEFPNRVVNIHAAPVRYNIDESQDEYRYLIGARILQITKSDRRYIDQYLTSRGVMSEVINTIIRRLYDSFVNRTRTRRSSIRLPLNVTLVDSGVKRSTVQPPLSMSGYLHDISKNGLSLVVPSYHFSSRYPVGSGYILQISVQLPNSRVSIQATPVRYNKLDNNQDEHNFLIGARIMQISASDRKHLVGYMQQAKKSKVLASETSFVHDTKIF